MSITLTVQYMRIEGTIEMQAANSGTTSNDGAYSNYGMAEIDLR